MKVLLNPQGSNEQHLIKFNGNKVQITCESKSYLYDFSSFSDGKMINTDNLIQKAEFVNGELNIVITNYINNHTSTEEVKFPQWQTIESADELDDNALIVPIEWITKEELEDIENAPTEPTEIEILQEKVAMQEQVIEELMFIIIPELTGGGI